MNSAIPPRLELPKVMLSPALLRRYAESRKGRAYLHEFIGRMEKVAEAEAHNLKIAQDAIRIVREALGEVAA